MAVRRVAAVVLLAAAAGFAGGCDAAAVPRKPAEQMRPEVPTGGTLLQGAGATFPSILYKQWFEQYHAAHPDRIVSYDAVGSGEGIRRFLGRDLGGDERVDFGASDAAISADEQAAAPDGALLVPATAGSVVIAYNLPGVAADLRLSREAYAGIFLGEITNWNDRRIAKANPGVRLPDLSIVTVVRQDGSGTTFAFTRHLDAVSDAWRRQYGAATLVDWPGSAMRASGNEGVAARITQSNGSIGYVGGEFARRAGLRAAVLENRAGSFVAPEAISAAAALAELHLPDDMRAYLPDPSGSGSYPIVTLTWILLHRTYDDPRKAAFLQDLFRWCLTDGQRYANELGYVPLPDEIARRSLQQLDRLQISSAPGTPAPAAGSH
jgi:phosphate transport system substrate-binding protein